MNTPQSSPSNQGILIQLEVVSDDEQQADVADIDEVGRDLFDELTENGYTVKPASTGKKGGGPLFDILLSIPRFVHDNKDWLEGLFDCLLIAISKRTEKEKTKRSPLKITLEVNGKPVVIETENPKDAVKLLEEAQKTQHDAVKIKVRVPKKKRRA